MLCVCFFLLFFLDWNIVAGVDDDSCLLHVLDVQSLLRTVTHLLSFGGLRSSRSPSCGERFILNKWCIAGEKLSLLFSQHPSIDF